MISISIALPNFNHSVFLRRSLDAIFSQTSPADEIIILDDASTDGSLEIIQPYLRQHPNCRLIINRVNQGIGSALQRLISEVTSDFILFTAADDCLALDAVKSAKSMAEIAPEAALLMGRCELITLKGQKRLWTSPSMGDMPEGFISPKDFVTLYVDSNPPWFSQSPSTAYNLKLLKQFGGFPADCGAFMDEVTNRGLGGTHGIVFKNKVLACLTEVPGSIGRSVFDDRGELEKTLIAFETLVRTKSLGHVFPPAKVKAWRTSIEQRYVDISRRRCAKGFQQIIGSLAAGYPTGPSHWAARVFLWFISMARRAKAILRS